MSQSEDSAQGGGDTQMDTDDAHFVQPAPPEMHPSTPNTLAKGKSPPEGPANTIMITNKYSNAGVTSQTQKSNNSIMILTSHNHTDVSSNITSSSQINICINNHFSDSITSSSATVTTESGDERLLNGKEAQQQQLDEPDSTTCHFKDSRSQPNTPLVVPPDPTASPSAGKNTPELEDTTNPPAADAQPPPKTSADFASGDEVLVHKGDVFYLGTIIVIGRKQACVYFGDDTKCWVYFDEMRKLNVTANGDASGPLCVHCKERSGKEPDSIVDVCKRCQRGYHKKCTGMDVKNGIHCRRCFEQNSLNGVNGGKYFNKNNNSMGDERLSFSDNSLSPFDTGNFFPLRTSDNKDAWSGSSNNSDLSTASSNGNHKGRKLYTCGRRLRERQEKNYAESTRRPPAAATNPQASTSSGCSDASSSSSSSSSLLNFTAATFLSQQLLSSQRSGAARGSVASDKETHTQRYFPVWCSKRRKKY
ncbi:polycomb protein Pcl isoform X3 [Lutzomyia longipalpis]|uniref:polycomb protein Pcl isoform X3 n=1 Tax=Lutzomyia longipalpis TaxID=7200 RepID=UPI00248425C5|nr:polycomb protein Pcl isoform X3 [Lutzomyia longipalpis]